MLTQFGAVLAQLCCMMFAVQRFDFRVTCSAVMLRKLLCLATVAFVLQDGS